MQTLTRRVNDHKQVVVTIVAATAIILVLVVIGYRLNRAEQERTETAQDHAVAAQAEADQAKSEVAVAVTAAKEVRMQAAPEFVVKATRALQAQHWEEALEAAKTATDLDPGLGEAWLAQGRAVLQAGDFAGAADSFAKASEDNTLDRDLRARASRLQALAHQYAYQQQRLDKLTMPQYMWLGKALDREGEMVLANWFFQLAGEELEAVKAQLTAAEERLKQDNLEIRPARRPMILRDEISWDLRDQPKLVDISCFEGLPLTSLILSGSSVTDLQPLKGMPLQDLALDRVQITDLSPLEGMPLRSVILGKAPILNLAPLAGAPLEILVGRATPVDDFSPLAGMPLRKLSLPCKAKDISVLRDMPLELLGLGGAVNVQDFSVLASLKGLKTLTMFSAQIRDLSVLEGLPLERLDLISCANALDLTPLSKLPLKSLNLSQVAEREDIAALAGMDLEVLNINRTRVSDLTPLKGMKLRHLLVSSYQPIHDYSVLDGMPLNELMVGWMPYRWEADVCLVPDTLGFLKDIKTLKKIRFGLEAGDLTAYEQVVTVGAALRAANSDYQAGAFYRLEAGQLTEVWMHECGVRNLSPLKGLKLNKVILSSLSVTDLTPLTGMPLQRVYLRNVPVADLTPLKGMALMTLDVSGTMVSDLTPVKTAPIEELVLTGSKVTDYGQVAHMNLRKVWFDQDLPADAVKTFRTMDTLALINNVESEKFWREYDAEHDK